MSIKSTSFVAGLLLSTALVSPALAKDADVATATAASDLGAEIVVTARHREEKLQDVPLAISAVGGQTLATQHLDHVADYAAKVPNFSALQQNTRVSGLYLRGLGGNASNDGAEGGVGLIVDNVVYDYVGFSWLDFVDLDGIEVVRGPQGTLLGKNTTLGAVIVKTEKPSWTNALNVSATYGNEGRWQLRSNATGAVTDNLAFRLTFSDSQGGGWITNAATGDKYLGADRWSVRGQLLWKPAPGVTDRLIVEHYSTDEYNNFYPPIADVNQNLTTSGAVFSQRAASWTNKLHNLFGYTPSFAAPYNANLDGQSRLKSHTDGVSNEANWDIGQTTLTSVSAWRELYFRPKNDSDYTPLPIFRNGYDVDVDQLTQELRLASRKGGGLDWTVGAYYLHEYLQSDLRTIFYQDASQFFLNSAAAPTSILAGEEADKDGRLHVSSIAGFGQATLNFTQALSLTTGLRYTSEHKSVTVNGYSFGGAAVTGALAANRAAVVGPNYAISDSVDNGSFSWLVNPSWKVGRHVRLYASASYGEKSGAVNTSATAGQAAQLAAGNDTVIVRPEKSLDFEGGVKSSWLAGRLIANLNLYAETIKDYQDSAVDPTLPTLASYLTNVGKVGLKGVELETSFEAVKGVTLSFNTGYNDAKYLSYANAPAPIEYQAYLATQQGVAAAATTLSLTGYNLRNAPKWTVQGGVNFDQPVGRNLRVTGYGDVAYRSATNLINPRSAYGLQAGYAVVNAGIGLKTEDDIWKLQLWSKNLFNKFYATAFTPASTSTPVTEVYGDPRSYGLTLSRKF